MRSSIVAAVAVSLAAGLVSSCVSRTQYMSQVNAARGLTDTLNKLRPYLDQLEQENKALQAEIARYEKTAADAAWVAAQRDKLAKLVADLEKEGGAGGIEGVHPVRDAEGRVGLRIDEQVLFESGKTAVSRQGRRTLAQLLPILTKGGQVVRVDGHTDADPIVKSSWKSNLHLSASRALAVADVLHSLGIPYDRILVAGYGPTRPVARAPGQKARNRRVELYLQ